LSFILDTICSKTFLSKLLALTASNSSKSSTNNFSSSNSRLLQSALVTFFNQVFTNLQFFTENFTAAAEPLPSVPSDTTDTIDTTDTTDTTATIASRSSSKEQFKNIKRDLTEIIERIYSFMSCSEFLNAIKQLLTNPNIKIRKKGLLFFNSKAEELISESKIAGNSSSVEEKKMFLSLLDDFCDLIENKNRASDYSMQQTGILGIEVLVKHFARNNHGLFLKRSFDIVLNTIVHFLKTNPQTNGSIEKEKSVVCSALLTIGTYSMDGIVFDS